MHAIVQSISPHISPYICVRIKMPQVRTHLLPTEKEKIIFIASLSFRHLHVPHLVALLCGYNFTEFLYFFLLLLLLRRVFVCDCACVLLLLNRKRNIRGLQSLFFFVSSPYSFSYIFVLFLLFSSQKQRGSSKKKFPLFPHFSLSSSLCVYIYI